MIVNSYWGPDVDTSGDIWVLDEHFKLDFKNAMTWRGPLADPGAVDPVLEAFQKFLRFEIARRAARSVHHDHHIIAKALRYVEIRSALTKPDAGFLQTAASVLRRERQLKPGVLKDHLSVLRRWYVHAVNANANRFVQDVAAAVQNTDIDDCLIPAVESLWGSDVDTSGEVWVLDDQFSLDFRNVLLPGGPFEDLEAPNPIVDAFKRFMRVAIARRPAASIHRDHRIIVEALRSKEVLAALAEPDAGFLHAAAAVLRRRNDLTFEEVGEHLSVLRSWYVHAASAGAAGFDPDAATVMERADTVYGGFDLDTASFMQGMVIGNGRIGTAVLRRDPGRGPLSKREYEAFDRALWEAVEAPVTDRPPLADLACCLLTMHLGCNPETLRRLDEADLKSDADREGNRTLQVPRIKKRGKGTFKNRLVPPKLAAVLDALVSENRVRFPPDPVLDAAHGRPLFRNIARGAKPSNRRKGLNWFYHSIRALPEWFGLEDDDGAPLHLFPRRLRYTFATRMVERGASPEELMELLDHSSLGIVLVYFNARLDLNPRLDAALGERLAPFANIAMGAVAPPPVVAYAGPGPDLGETPFACLTCKKFVPTGREAIERASGRLESRIAVLRPRRGAVAEKELAACATVVRNAAKASQAIQDFERNDK